MPVYLKLAELSELNVLKCPLCNKKLADDEYGKAILELESKVEERYEKQNLKYKKEFEKKLSDLKEQHDKEKTELKKFHDDQLNEWDKVMQESRKKEMEIFKKEYDSIAKEAKKQFDELVKHLKGDHKKELEQKEKEIKQLESDRKKFQEQGYEKAKDDFERKMHKKDDEIDEHEIQIKRLKVKITELDDQISKTQSELKGEVGELNLYETLTNVFSDDHFTRQTRGQSTGDLIQTIRTKTGKLDTRIIYDNKQDTSVTAKDLEKAKKYQKIHNTKYVLIVSSKIPKTYSPNGIYGIKDGILIVNPKIIIEVATRCRDNIIEISKLSESAKGRDAKEAKLFDYIISQEFNALMGTVYQANEKLRKLQDQEEKTHLRWWKDRKTLRDQLIKAYMEIETGVESITQKGHEIKKVQITSK